MEETTLLKAKRQKLKIAVEAAEAYNKLQPPHQTIGDAVVMALAKAGPIYISEKGKLPTHKNTEFQMHQFQSLVFFNASFYN